VVEVKQSCTVEQNCSVSAEVDSILKTPSKKVITVSNNKTQKVRTEKVSKVSKVSKTETKAKAPEVNKAAKLREMFEANASVTIAEAKSAFQKIGHTLQPAQFYQIKKKFFGPAKTSKKTTTKSKTMPAVAVAAKSAHPTTPSVDSILQARNILQAAYNEATTLLGCEDSVRTVFKDLK